MSRLYLLFSAVAATLTASNAFSSDVGYEQLRCRHKRVGKISR